MIDIDGEDEDLLAEAVEIKYRQTSSGKLRIRGKTEVKKRLNGRSPDDRDGLVLAFASRIRRLHGSRCLALPDFVVEAFAVPKFWSRVFAMP